MRTALLFALLACVACSAAQIEETGSAKGGVQSRIGEILGQDPVNALAELSDWRRVTIETDDRDVTMVIIQKDDPSMGPLDAPVTIVIFSDFQCPFCSRHEVSVAKVAEQYKGLVRVVFKQFPLKFHKMARPASRASLAAHEQGQFWIMHDVLFANARDLHYANFVKWAGELDMDVDRFKKVIDDPQLDMKINQDIKEARSYGVQGTPTLFINGVMVVGAVPASDLNAYIKLGLARAWVALNNGIPQKDLYVHLSTKTGPGAPPGGKVKETECIFDKWGLPNHNCY
jgi:protein-disulfide isomerase